MPRRDAELKARLLATFQVEADEHLVALRRHLLALAGDGGGELVEATFRDMHTLKGAARSVGLRDVERVCACCETLLSVLSRTGTAPGPPVVALLEDAVAVVGTLVHGEGAKVPGDLLERLQAAAADPLAVGEPPAASSSPSGADAAGWRDTAAGSPYVAGLSPSDGAGSAYAAGTPATGAGLPGDAAARPAGEWSPSDGAGSPRAAGTSRAAPGGDAAARPAAGSSSVGAGSPDAAGAPLTGSAPSDGALARPAVGSPSDTGAPLPGAAPPGDAAARSVAGASPSAGAGAPARPAASPPTNGSAPPTPVRASPRAPETIRMATDELDTLLRRGEELLSIKLVADEWVASAEALSDTLRKARSAEDPAAQLRALEGPARELVNGLRRDRRTIAGAVDGLLDQARRVRMMPASTVLDLLPLIARDLAHSQDKRVTFEAAGGDLLVDRRVLEAIKDPLIHMVRNAVDHGLELPDERTAAGKPPTGRIAVTLTPLERGRLELKFSDDGRGIDSERVQAAAKRARIPAPESDEEALALLFRSGLSTSFVITDVSGHGLGLAIVKEQVERLGGSVEIDSRPRAGTTIRLIIPATIATFRGLLVRAGGQRFLLPLDSVERVIPAEPLTVRGREMIEHEGELLPCSALSDVLYLPSEQATERRACAIVTAAGERAALLVDEVLGDREVLVKDFEPPLIRIRNVAAAGLLGGGELVLVLRTPDLVKGISERPVAPESADLPAEPPWVLVVDDAVTTRAMERGLLELAGYQVKVAVDGMDAWTALKSDHFDLVVSDVDMPRMNGFELTQRIRADEGLQDLPVVLVSALEAREDKERGIEVGANAYVVKSSFEQSNLLEIINRLGVRP